ncbi:hypothetical protein [Intrasporangium sp.]|uniref:hypothetical protein n=1 Tax=Intrasporangium sp. TaxID=1925024 RepID=UPI00293AED45|nr:hypothetical protein [Intrasporangium sp.]MDV3220333.1 hypothetical protein [Intrasporangium sp.]
MAIYRKGSDPVALRASAERIAAHARECEALRTEAGRAVHSLKGHWGGGDLDHLMSRWPPLEAQLGQFTADLGTLVEALRRNAGQQDMASGPGGGLPGGGPGWPSGPSGPGGPGGSGGAGGSGGGVDILGGLGKAMPIIGLPTLFGQTAGVLSTFSKADGWFGSGRYLSTITQMARVGDPMLDLFPTASRFGAGANLFADMWDMKGLSGLFAEGSTASRVVGKFGVLGPIGIGVSAASFANSVVQGDVGGMVENGLGTALAAGAVFAPPPANVVCGVAGLGLAAYQNIPAVHDAVNAVGEGIVDVGEGIADAAGDAWDTVSGWF